MSRRPFKAKNSSPESLRTFRACSISLHLRSTPFQNTVEAGEEGDGGNGGGQNIADRLCQKHAEHRVGHDVGQNEDERDHDMCDRRCSDRGRVVGSRKRIIFASKKKGETKK